VTSLAYLRSVFSLPDFSRKPYFKFITDRSGPFDGDVVLNRDRVYIMPTKTGFIFLLLLFVLLLGSVNYGKSLGYMLTFLLAGLGNVAMFATWRNLAGLRLRSGGSTPVFAGQDTSIAVQLENLDPTIRYSLAITHDGDEYDVVDVPADGVALIYFQIATQKRGLYKPGHFRLLSEFPTGLFIAWTWIEFTAQYLVYPKPAQKVDQLISNSLEEGDDSSHGRGMHEYAELRKYQPGDSWRRVSWKATARVDELHTREFSGGKLHTQWIEWNSLITSGTENRLSQMTRLVIDAEAAAGDYGLRLPAMEITPDHGSAHYQHCLKALALYGKS